MRDRYFRGREDLGIADIYRRQGHLGKAQFHFKRALDEEGWDRYAGLWRSYGEILADRQDFEGAVTALRRETWSAGEHSIPSVPPPGDVPPPQGERQSLKA